MSIVLFSETDSLQLTLNELIGPTPQYAKVFSINMSAKLKKLPSHLVYESSPQPEEELLDFFKEKAIENTKFKSLHKIELRWYQHEVIEPNKAPTSTVVEKKTLIYA